ncbi:MAG: mechanosensitive ion channel family protein [Desulfobulbaceae bacterium]|nr:mechanosensitive ion channel family protein [Desulfobulbaceae bacterium]
MDLGFIPHYIHTFEGNPYLHRVLVIICYIILMKLTDLLVDRVLRRLAARTSIALDDVLVDFSHGPLCWTVFWIGVGHALLIEPLHEPWQTVFPALTKSMILAIWIHAAIKFFNWLVGQKLASQSDQDKIGRDVFVLLKNLIRVVIIAAGLLWLLAIWKVDLTPLFASAGIAGVALALAAKDTLANFFGGVSVFMDKAYQLGDYIILDSGDRGEVMEIGIRSTRIKTSDDVLITIPNSLIANAKIINESAPLPRFRIRVPLGVAYASDLEQVEQVLLQVAAANPNVAPEPEPRVRYRSFGDSAINLELLCWVENPAQKGLEIHNLIKAVHRACAENRITIPFPQREVRFREAKPAELTEATS